MKRKFFEVLTIINGKNQREVEDSNGEYPIYGSGGIIGYANKFLCPGNTVIIGRKGNINKPIYVDKPFWNVDTAFGLLADEKILLPKYLFYFCQRYNFEQHNKTVTIPSLTKADLLEIVIDVPEIDVQKRICKELDLIDSVICNRVVTLSTLDVLVKSQFIEMFGNLSKGSDSENSITLQEMLDRKWITYHLDGNHGGDYPRSHEFIDDGVPYISANCIVNGKIDFSRGKYVSEERANRFRKGIACNKDVLFAHNATVGPVVVLETQYPKVILGTSLTAYRCDCEHIISEYLKAYMEHPIFTQQYEADMQQTTRNQVPITKQRNYRFIIPKMSYQKEFAAFVELTDKSKLAVQQSIETLQTLKEKLMQDYFG